MHWSIFHMTAAVGRAAEVVEETPPQQFAVAPRVEGERAVHELLHGVERRRIGGERLNLAGAGGPGLGADVDRLAGQAPTVPSPGQRVRAAQRHSHEHEPLDLPGPRGRPGDRRRGSRSSSPSRATTRFHRGRARGQAMSLPPQIPAPPDPGSSRALRPPRVDARRGRTAVPGGCMWKRICRRSRCSAGWC